MPPGWGGTTRRREVSGSTLAPRARVPYLLDVQTDLLEVLATRVVVPLCKPEVLKGKTADRLNPVFEVEGRRMVMLTPELAGVSRKRRRENEGLCSWVISL